MKLACNDKILELSSPAVMGILNVTPDSFYDGGNYRSEKTIAARAEEIISEGAEIIDVGGYSTRPGAATISETEELKRALPAIQLIRKNFPQIIISIDTFRSEVAKRAYEEGAGIINDISGGIMDSGMFKAVSKMKAAYVLTHMQGRPQTMQNNPSYKNAVKEIKAFFAEKISVLKMLGKENIILDVGFGFGKTTEHNYELLNHLSEFKQFGHLSFPVLAGVSRKSMITKVLGVTPENALNGTTAVNTIALMHGANLLRVHDVKEAKEVIKFLNLLSRNNRY